MNAVPRHIFVDEALAIRAYDDAPLPIGHGQTISQPWVVARMTELARNGRDARSRARDRHRLRLPDGGARARRAARLQRRAHRRAGRQGAAHLQSLKLKNVSLKHGDGSHDLGEDARGRRDRRHRRRDARAHGAAALPEAGRPHGAAARAARATSAACSG